jgi:hypothetical protein
MVRNRRFVLWVRALLWGLTLVLSLRRDGVEIGLRRD